MSGQVKPSVLFGGCWGYGNVGDDAYRSLWPTLLPECECLLDQHGRLDRWGRVDAVVIGGGGVVNSFSDAHERRITEYAAFARERKIPLVFASVGVQHGGHPERELVNWRQALEQATAVTARTPADAEVIRAVAPAAKVSHAPDLAYLVEPSPARLIEPGRDVVVPMFHEGQGWDRSLMGEPPPGCVILCMCFEDLPGCWKLAVDGDRDVLHSLTAAECAAVFRDAGTIRTARYHGKVLARAAGRDDAIAIRRPWKIKAEPPFIDRNEARRHADAIRQAVGINPPPPGVIHRPGTMDAGIWHAVVDRNEYRLPETMRGQIALDVGGHTGSFVGACKRRGAAEVWAVEADAGNLDLLIHNTHATEGKTILQTFHAGVWRSDRRGDRLRLVPHDGNNTGCGRTLDRGSAEVPSVELDVLVKAITDFGRRRLDWLKLDCEGAEWPILFTARSLHQIDNIVGEYHAGVVDQLPEMARIPGVGYSLGSLRSLLERAGFAVEILPPNSGKFNLFFARRRPG